MVELALVMPVMVVLLLAVSDFARAFAAGVVVEAAARNAAEIAAQDYLARSSTAFLENAAADPQPAAFYQALADKAARAVCAEARSLPASDYAASGTCPTWPKVRVCVHDGDGGGLCGAPVPGFASDTPETCPQLGQPWSPASQGGSVAARYVEVRVCERFPLLIGLAMIPTELYIERTRVFTIACWYRLGPAECG